MLRLIALLPWLLLVTSANAFWQSRDSNSNIAIGGVGPAAPFIQVLAGTGAAINSGLPTVLTSTAAVPVGSTVVVAVNLNATANQSVTSCADGTANTYVVAQPAAAASVLNAALCYSVNTTNNIPLGSVWTVVTAGGQYNVRGVWYVTGYNGGLDQSATVNQATAGTAVAGLATTTLANVADLAIGYAYVNTGTSGVITESPLFTNLFNNSNNTIGYDAVTSTAALSYAPSWISSSAYSAVLLALLPTGAVAGCTEATTFLARTSGLSGTQTTAYTNLICGLVTDGVWAKLDGLYVYATNTTTTANLNLKSTSFSSTVNGTCTFTANTGYLGVTSCYQDTGYSPNVGGTNYTLNAASIGLCDLTSRATPVDSYLMSTVSDVATFTDFTAIAAPAGSATVNFGINQGGVAFASANVQGSWIASRTASNLTTFYKNGVSVASGTDLAGALSSQHLVVMAYNRAGVLQKFALDRFAYAFFGGALTGTDAGNLYNRLHTYLSAVGAPAGC